MGLPAYADGNFPFGSQIVTLNGIDYVAEEINFEEPTNEKDRHDQVGNVNAALYQSQKITGTMTLQLASLTTPIPNRFDIVNLIYRNAPKAFLVVKVGQPQKFDDFRKIQVEIREKLN